MNQKSNGKLVIAIVAMFAVALSIIGLTYAYFTATFNVNPEDKSVIVNAGKLMANFNGESNIAVKDIVPGWKSNGLSYYDSSAALENGGKIYASELKTRDEIEKYYGSSATEIDKLFYDSKGLTQPIKFTVSNDKNSPDSVNFIIRLTGIKNGIHDLADTKLEQSLTESDQTRKEELRNGTRTLVNDIPNLRVYLYEGTFDYSQKDNSYGGTLISTAVLGYNFYGDASNYNEIYEINGDGIVATLNPVQSTQVLSTAVHTLAPCTNPGKNAVCGDNTRKNYFVIFGYSNEEDSVQLAQGVNIQAKVEILGVQEDNTVSGKWYDADNQQVVFANSRTN